MDNKKTFKNILILLICLLGITLIGVNIYQHHKINKAKQVMSLETSSDNETTTEITLGGKPVISNYAAQGLAINSGESQALDNEAEELAYHLEAAEEELEMINQQLSEEEAKKTEKRRLQREFQQKYLEDPSHKKSTKRSLDTRYADLFKKLNLSSEKLDNFKDLLVEEMMAQEYIYLDYDDTANLSKEEQEELQQRYVELNKEYETKYTELLGENGYEIYQAYMETRSQRYNVNNFLETLGTDEKLTESQKENLIKAMNEELNNITWKRADDDSESSSNMYDEENMARSIANYKLRIDAYSRAAGSILSASQLDKFNTYLQKELDQFKLYIELDALRYGSSTTQNSAEKESE